MKNRFLNGFRTIVLSRLALTLGLLYLIYPLHHQITGMLHIIAHHIEAPHYVLSHNLESMQNYSEHGVHEHRFESLEHDHALINWIDSVFELSEWKHCDSKPYEELSKFDKYLSSLKYHFPKNADFLSNDHFWTAVQKSMKGYLIKIFEPPNNTLISLFS